MSIARRKRRKATWQEALAAGQQQLAVWRYLLEYAGSHPLSVWTTDWPDLERRLQGAAAAFVAKHDLNVEWGAADSRAVRRAVIFVVDWILHLAHWIFGRPRYGRWREDRERWRVTMDFAQWEIDRHLRLKSRIIRDVNLDRKQRQERDAYRASDLYAGGSHPDEIAEILGCSRRTVFNHLKATADLRPDPQ